MSVLDTPTNLDFDAGATPDGLPVGWEWRGSQHYEVAVDTDVPHNSGASVRIRARDASTDVSVGVAGLGALTQTIDASPLHGKRVSLTAWLRAENVGRGFVALRGEDIDGAMVCWANIDRDPIVGTHDWVTREVVMDVPVEAARLTISVGLARSGTIWIDDVNLSELSVDAAMADEPRPLSEQGLTNLVALTRLLGYVRYFHPSDEAASTDWDTFSIESVMRCEPAADAQELAAILMDLFRPIAPTVRVFPSGTTPELPEELHPPDDVPTHPVSWVHFGGSVVGSRRFDPTEPTPPVTLIQEGIDACPYRGASVRLHARARAELGPDGDAYLWIRAFTSEGALVARETTPVRDSEWTSHSLSAEIPDDAVSISVGLVLQGRSSAGLAAVSLEGPAGVLEDAQPRNAQFQDGGVAERPPGWYVIPRDTTGDYLAQANYIAEIAERPDRHAVLRHVPFELRPEQPLVTDLGGGVSCMIPITLLADNHGTIPRSSNPRGNQQEPHRRPRDRTTRLATVAMCWNVFQHFYPYFDVVDVDWDAALEQALRRAAEEEDSSALPELVALAKDGHGAYTTGSGTAGAGFLPVALAWAEDAVVVSSVRDAAVGIERGDVLEAIDHVAIDELFEQAQRRRSVASPQAARWWGLRALERGANRQTVTLTVRSPGDELRDVVVTRQPGRVVDPLPQEVEEIEAGVVYIDLTRISYGTFTEWLPRLVKAHGTVFDMRGYPSVLSNPGVSIYGHLTSRPVEHAQLHVPVVTRPDRQGWRFAVHTWWLLPREPKIPGRVAFLTDASAISAAETFLSLVEHGQLAEIVGEATAGTNGPARRVKLPESTLSYTTVKVVKQDGSRHHGVGIQPTVPVHRTIEGIAEGRDEVLETAIAVVRGLDA